MDSAIDQILCMQDTILFTPQRVNLNQPAAPYIFPKEAVGSKRQILSAIGPMPILIEVKGPLWRRIGPCPIL